MKYGILNTQMGNASMHNRHLNNAISTRAVKEANDEISLFISGVHFKRLAIKVHSFSQCLPKFLSFDLILYLAELMLKQGCNLIHRTGNKHLLKA